MIRDLIQRTVERVVPEAMADEWERLARTKYKDQPAVMAELLRMAAAARRLTNAGRER